MASPGASDPGRRDRRGPRRLSARVGARAPRGHAADRDPGMNLLGWACESGDAGDVGSLAHSATGGGLGSLNSLGLADRALGELIGAADRARTDRQRALRLRPAPSAGRICFARPRLAPARPRRRVRPPACEPAGTASP